MSAIFHKSCEISIFYIIRTEKIVESYLINKHGGKNPKLLNKHAGKCANIMELKSIFIKEHVLLLDR